MSTTDDPAQPSNQTLVLERRFDAPRELVFKVWTEPQHLAQWWGPKGYTTPVCELDVRPGGAIRIDMQGSDGVVIPSKGVFIEVTPPERLVFTLTTFEDEVGEPQLEVHNTVTFEEDDGKTNLTLKAIIMKATAAVSFPLSEMEAGWSQSLDKLAEAVARVEYSGGQ